MEVQSINSGRRKALQPHQDIYEEKIGYTRGSLWAPFHAVGMVMRIKGNVQAGPVMAALRKLEVLYPPLASRVRVEKNGDAWLTTEAVEPCSLEVQTHATMDDWKKVVLEQERRPFAFESGPIGRFFLLRGQDCSDLIAVVPHVICDGLAMTQVMSDAISLLNDPGREVKMPAPPAAVTWQSVPHAAGDALLLRGLIKTVNHVWPKNQAGIRQAGYEELHRRYWEQRQNGMLMFELSPAQTAQLAARCKQHGVAITGALTAAFLLAQGSFRLHDVTVAVNIRNRMVPPPGRVMRVYASAVNLTRRPGPGTNFWELAHACHTRIHHALDDRARLLLPVALGEIDPSIADRGLRSLCSGQLARRLGPLARLVKFEGLNPNLDISNIGRVEMPETGGRFCPITLLSFPPLWPAGGLAVSAISTNGRMNVTMKFRLDQLDEAAAVRISERASGILTGEQASA
jgi:hypothetical protein